MRLGCLLPLVAIALIVGGGQGVYTGLKNRNLTELTIESIVATKPSNEWLKITGGTLDVMNSTYTSTFGKGAAKSIYVPLVPAKVDSAKETIHVLIKTKDADLLQFTNDVRKLEDSKGSDAVATAFFLKNMDKMKITKTVQGLVKFGIESDDKEIRKIRELYDNLASDVIVVEEGATPSTATGFAMLAGGLVLGVVLVVSSGKSKATPPAMPGAPPPLPPTA